MSKRKLMRFAGEPERVETGYPAKYFYVVRLDQPKPTMTGSTSVVPVMVEISDNEVVAVHRAMVD